MSVDHSQQQLVFPSTMPKYLYNSFLQSCTIHICKSVTTVLHVISIFLSQWLLKALIVKGLISCSGFILETVRRGKLILAKDISLGVGEVWGVGI